MKKLKDESIIKKLANELGLGRPPDPERAIRTFCLQKVDGIYKRFNGISDLDRFLEIIGSSLGIKFEEVHDEEDLINLKEKYLNRGELIFADLHRQLDDKTDAVLIELVKKEEWEPSYVAIIDCRGFKKYRSYFSKWHEIGHVLTTPAQMSFRFRRTPVSKKDPEEQLVDRIAGDLAFYSPIVMPDLLIMAEKEKRITFDIIENLRNKLSPEASRESSIRGTLTRSPFPQLFVIAELGLKKDEERMIRQMDIFPNEINNPIIHKLRAVEVIANDAGIKAGLWIYPNMEVPEESIINKIFEDPILALETQTNSEDLSWWKHSRGRLENRRVWVEALKIGNRVFGLISLLEN